MLWLRQRLDRVAPHFEKGGRLHRWHPLWEAMDTFFYAPSSVTTTISSMVATPCPGTLTRGSIV